MVEVQSISYVFVLFQELLEKQQQQQHQKSSSSNQTKKGKKMKIEEVTSEVSY